MLTGMNAFNIGTDLCGLMLCFLGSVGIYICRKVMKSDFKIFLTMFLVDFLLLLSNMFGILFKGSMSNFALVGIPIFNFCEFALAYTLSMVLSIYIIDTVDPTKKRREYMGTIFSMYFIAIASLIVSQYTDLYYYIDANNVYHRAEYFWVSQIFGLAFMLFDVIFIVAYRKSLEKKQRIAFLFYVGFPMVAMVIQNFVYGIFLTQIATSIAVVVMIMLMLFVYVEHYKIKEKELLDSQIAIMMSQIKPHFLYNALSAIAQLYDSNPAMAKQATIAFADYLRHNMNSLEKKRLIPFKEELEHIKTYLFLEQMRFGDELKVQYDIRTEAFSVPTLSVQPIVENAVKWGVGEKEEGGTVRISTKEYTDKIEIVVSDTGNGFDEANMKADTKRSHIGIQNVKERLAMMCHSTMQIDSSQSGTVVTITIPKGGENEYTCD